MKHEEKPFTVEECRFIRENLPPFLQDEISMKNPIIQRRIVRGLIERSKAREKGKESLSALIERVSK